MTGSFAKYMLQLLKFWEQGESVFPANSIPSQNEMSAFLWIERAEGSHGTPTEGKVSKMGMFETHRSGTEVVGGCSEDA